MEEYKSNSYRSREAEKSSEEMPRKIVQKAISGTARTRASKTRKLSDIFLAEDMDSVKSYVFSDVLVPAIKKAVVDIISDGVHMIFYGDKGYSTKRSTVDRVSYDRQYRKADGSRNESRPASRTRFSYEDVIVETRGEAERVIDLMGEMVDSYGMVRVADLYDLVDLSCDYTCNNYGWTDISRAEAVRLRDGSYMIKMPRAIPLSR